MKPQLLISVLFFSTIASCTSTSKKDLIVGRWSFEKFYFEGELADAVLPGMEEANNVNKGLVLVFTSDNKYKSEQKGGMERNNMSGTYSLSSSDKDKIVIMGDTVKIMQLDKTHLKIYRDSETPIAVFKRQ